jgi:hypothetical protein
VHAEEAQPLTLGREALVEFNEAVSIVGLDRPNGDHERAPTNASAIPSDQRIAGLLPPSTIDCPLSTVVAPEAKVPVGWAT